MTITLNFNLVSVLMILLALSIIVDIYKLFFKKSEVPDPSPDVLKEPETVQVTTPEPPPTPIPTEATTPAPAKKSKQKGDGYRTRSGVKPLHWNVIETPPPNYRKFRSCELKHDFRSLAEANEVVKKMLSSSKLKQTNKELHGYKCDFCNYYHIGHKSANIKSVN